MGNCSSGRIQPQNNNPVPIERLRAPAYLRLNVDMQLSDDVRTVNPSLPPSNLAALSGLYAFCLANTNNGEQYLLLKTLDRYESNHGIFDVFLKKIPGYSQQSMQIIAGGEIAFRRGEIITWIVRSFQFSKGGVFDESHPSFNENLKRLWLPRSAYQSIAKAQGYG